MGESRNALQKMFYVCLVDKNVYNFFYDLQMYKYGNEMCKRSSFCNKVTGDLLINMIYLDENWRLKKILIDDAKWRQNWNLFNLIVSK